MKNKFYLSLLLLLMLAFIHADAQTSANVNLVDHYYYWNKRIDLQPRNDRVLVIFRDGGLSASEQQNLLTSSTKLASESVNSVDKNIWMLKTPDIKAVSEFETLKQSLTTKNDDIKLITKVYYGDSESVIQFPMDEIFVRLKSMSDKSVLDGLNKQNQAFIVSNISNEKSFLVKTTDQSKLNALQLADIYRKAGIFEFVEPNFGFAEWSLLHQVPDDPFFPSQWALRNISQPVPTGGITTFGDVETTNGITGADMDVVRAWQYTTGSPSIVVGVLDTGIDVTHPDLLDNIVPGYDATTNTYGPDIDPNGHGTACAGLIAAVMNNGIGVAGVAPSTKLMNLRIFNSGGNTTALWIIRALDTAFVKKVDILSNSWGGGAPSAAIESSFNQNILNGRNGLGAIALASTGNDARNPPNYPAAYDNVVGIGASTPQDSKKSPGSGNQFWWGGNYGEFSATSYMAFVAPTVCYTTATGGGYLETFNGTSASCPNAAGVAALVMAVNTGLTSLQTYEFMARGADKIDNVAYDKQKTYGQWNEYYGYGRLNAYNAVRLAAGVDVTPPSIVHKNIGSHSSTYPTLLTAEILDHDGTSVPATGEDRPKLFFRHKLVGGSWSDFDSISAFGNTGTNFTFKIPGFGYGTEVNYYIRARDIAGNETTFPKHAKTLTPYTLCYFGIGEMVQYSGKISNWNFDNGVSNSPLITVPATHSHPLVDLNVRIYLRHNWFNDLTVLSLWSPSADAGNNRKAIWGRNYPPSTLTPSGGINGSRVFDDATSYWKDGYLPSGLWTEGNYKPDHPFQGLMGINMDGDWRFTGRDIAFGDLTLFDSIRVNLTGLGNLLSACARHDMPEDTIALFPATNKAGQIDFYLKNTGNAALDITGFSISGPFASKFSVTNAPNNAVLPGDSCLFIIAFDPTTAPFIDFPLAGKNAELEILTNDPSKNSFNVSLQNDCANPTDGGEISGDNFVCFGNVPGTFVSVAAPEGLAGIWEYQWQISTSSPTFVDIVGAASETYTHVGAVTQTTWFKRLARVGCATGTFETNSVSSNVLQVIVDPLPTASAGGSTAICVNASATVSGATAANGTVLWSHNGAGTLDNPGTLTPTYNAVSGDAGNTVTLTMTVTSDNTCGTATATATFAIVVEDCCINPTNGGEIAGDQSICIGTSPDPFTSESLPTGHTGNLEYQWQITTSSPTFVDIPGAVSETYTHIGTVTQTTWFRRLARVSCAEDWSNAAESNTVMITLNGLSGVVSYYRYNAPNTPLPGVVVKLLNASGDVIGTSTTTVDGEYEFTDLTALQNTAALQVSTTRPHGGLSALDAYAIQMRGVFNPLVYWTPDTFLDHVGDVYYGTDRGTINGLDAFLTQYRGVFPATPFESDDWAFYAPVLNEVFENTDLSTAQLSFEFNRCELNIEARTFGDVNGSYTVAPMKSASSIQLKEYIQIESGKVFELPLFTMNDLKFNAMTLELEFNDQLIEILDIKSAIPQFEFSIEKGTIKISWFDLSPMMVNEGESIITLIARTIGQIDQFTTYLSETNSTEFGDESGRIIQNHKLGIPGISNVFDDTVNTLAADITLAAVPNPFKENAEVYYTLPMEANVRIVIVNALGVEILELVNGHHKSGIHKQSVNNLKGSLTSGVYFIQMHVNDNLTSTSKVLKIIRL